MAVRIRLRRMGKKKSPCYRLAVVDSRVKRDGRFIEFVGFYDPTTQPYILRFKEERIIEWLRMGASLSDTVESLLRREGLLRRWHELRTGQKVEPITRKPSPEAEPGKVAEKAEAPKEAVPKAEAPREAAPKAEAAREAVPKAEAPREVAPKAEAPKEEAPLEKAEKNAEKAVAAKKKKAAKAPKAEEAPKVEAEEKPGDQAEEAPADAAEAPQDSASGEEKKKK